MYTLSTIKEPLPLNFSRNPIICAWNVSPYSASEAALNTVLTVKLEVHTSSGLQIRVLQCRPDGKGNVQLDLRSMIDIYLEHSVPDLNTYELQVSNNNICRFAVSAVLTNDYEQIGVAQLKTYRCMKGGLPKEQNLLQQFLGDNLLQKKQFLRYPFAGETKDVRETFILSALAYISDNEILINSPGEALLSYRFRSYTGINANAWVVVASDEAIQFGRVVHLPFCIKDLLPDYTTAQAVEIEIVLTMGAEVYVIGSQKFYLSHNREQLNSCITYVNSLGGYEAISLYQIEEKQFNYSKTKAELIDFNEFASKNVIKATSSIYDLQERASPKARTLPMHQHELNRLRALFLCQAAFVFRNKKMIPVAVNDSNLSITTTEGLYSIQVSWEEQIVNANYMPEDSIDEDGVCPVPSLFLVTHVESDVITVQYAFSVNQYKGLLTFARNQPPVADVLELELDQNEGKVSVDVSALNVTNTSLYAIDVGLKTICSAAMESSTLIRPIVVSKVSKPTVPVLNATTYEGAGYRTLVFQHGNSSMFQNAQTNFNTLSWVMGRANPLFNIPSGPTVAGGVFNIVVVNAGLANQESRLSYSPPAGFTGMDIINYYAYTKVHMLPTAMESLSLATKIYVTVEAANGVAPPPSSQKIVYVRLDVDTVDKHRGWATDNKKFTHYKDAWLRFFSDPYGNTPLDVTGLGITVQVEVSWNGDASYFGNTSGTEIWSSEVVSGLSTYFEYKTKLTRKKQVSEFTNEIRPSNFYYIIL